MKHSLYYYLKFILFCGIFIENVELQINLNEEYLQNNCNSDTTGYIRSDPDNNQEKCLSFNGTSENGDLFCENNIQSPSGNIEICFNYFGKKLVQEEDSGGCIGLKEVSSETLIWFACASKLNEINSQTFYYLKDTNSWNYYCIAKKLKSSTNYQLSLQDYQNAGQQTNDCMFKNITITFLQELDENQIRKQEIESKLSSSDIINQIKPKFEITKEQNYFFQLQLPNLQQSYLQQEIYLTGKSTQTQILNFNPQCQNISIENKEYYNCEQLINIDDFKYNDDSIDGYNCPIINNIKQCIGFIFFYFASQPTEDRQKTFEACQTEAIMSYRFELRVNLSDNSTYDQQQPQVLKQITKIPCSDSNCTALIGKGELANITYTTTMCKNSGDQCEKMQNYQFLWGKHANFEFQSFPAIRFHVYKAFIYKPFYQNSSIGEGEELNMNDIVTTHSKHGLLKIKYQISSEASTLGNSISLKFLLKQKKNSTKRQLKSNGDDGNDDDDGIIAVDVSNIKILDENQTLSYLVEDEDAKFPYHLVFEFSSFLILLKLILIIRCLKRKTLEKEKIKEQNEKEKKLKQQKNKGEI